MVAPVLVPFSWPYNKINVSFVRPFQFEPEHKVSEVVNIKDITQNVQQNEDETIREVRRYNITYKQCLQLPESAQPLTIVPLHPICLYPSELLYQPYLEKTVHLWIAELADCQIPPWWGLRPMVRLQRLPLQELVVYILAGEHLLCLTFLTADFTHNQRAFRHLVGEKL